MQSDTKAEGLPAWKTQHSVLRKLSYINLSSLLKIKVRSKDHEEYRKEINTVIEIVRERNVIYSLALVKFSNSAPTSILGILRIISSSISQPGILTITTKETCWVI